jgi:hypothetical protein
MAVTYQSIQDAYQAPPAGQNVELLAAFDAMADMEKSVLGFLDPGGLTYDYGATNLPETLPGRYPCVLHLPAGKGTLRSLTTMGSNSLIAHPGGTRIHTHPFDIHWIVGERGQHVKLLIAKTLFWCKAVDQAYAANGSLHGQVKQIGLATCSWGEFSYSTGDERSYFAWVFTGTLELQYSMKGGG